MSYYLLTFLALFVLPASSEFVPVCNPAEFILGSDHPPLPTDSIPDQFFYTARADIVELMSTYYVSEYFDGPGNRGRFETDAFGSVLTVIADYNLQEAFLLDGDTGECTVNILQTVQSSSEMFASFIFGIVPGQNGTVHVGLPSFFLMFNNESARYLGNDTIRGVPCLHWQTCTVSEHNTSSYIIDYYFSDPSSGWIEAGGTNSVPILLVLKGQNVNGTTGSITEMEHYYAFATFQGGSDVVPDDLFQVPLGVACKGRVPGQQLPPFPSYFSASSEYVNGTYAETAKVISTVCVCGMYCKNSKHLLGK